MQREWTWRAAILILALFVLSVPNAIRIQGAAYNEAPMLAERMAKGALPSVEKRLPTNPMVLKPLQETGQYGGTLRFPFTGNVGWDGLLYSTIWESLTTFAPDGTTIIPNLAQEWKANDSATEWTFKLREGTKWSDGEPFTVDDIVFAVNDIWFDTDVTPAGPWWSTLKIGDKPLQVEKIDDLTAKFVFAQPNAFFAKELTGWPAWFFTHFPKHYLEKYHKKYNPDVQKLVDDSKGQFADWVAMFNYYANTSDVTMFYEIPDRPTLNPWIVTKAKGSGTQLIMERNPYFWQVDPDGNQLPYIDKIVADQFQNQETIMLAALNGEYDFLQSATNKDRPVLADNEAKAHLRVTDTTSDGANTASIHLNRTAKDPVQREIFANKDFRIGLSYAINRQEIIDVLFFGQGKPWQVAPLEGSPLYNEKFGTQYTEYSVEKAGEYLDKVVPNKDADGYRLRPDGKRLTVVLSATDQFGAGWPDVGEMVAGYWKKVGVNTILDVVTPEIYEQRRSTNDLEAGIWTSEGGAGLTALYEPRYFVPGEYWGIFALGWSAWVRDPKDPNAVEPPTWVKEQRALYDQIKQTPDQAKQIEMMKQIIDKAADEFYVMGISTPPVGAYPVNESLGNIPDVWMRAWITGNQHIIFPQQWFFHKT